MPERSIEEEQLPTASVKNDHALPSEPMSGQYSGTEMGIMAINGSTPYVEGRHPHDNSSASSAPSTTLEDDRSNDEATAQSVLSDLKQHLDKSMEDLKDQNGRSFEKILMVMQHESAKRIALEQRLHSQLLLQNETMVAMELKLIRLESKVERREAAQKEEQRVGNVRSNAPAIQTIEEVSRQVELRVTPQHGIVPANMAAFSSGASLANGVPVGSSVGDESERQSRADEDAESQQSTTTLGSRAHNPIAGGNLESILLNPMLGETNNTTTAHSILATRGDTDENSSLGTAVTNSTMTCTVGTATTRGDYSIRDRFLSLDPENRRATSALTEDSYNTSSDAPRSRSNSPLTIQSYTVNSEAQNVGSGASQSTAIMSSVAVAPARTADVLQNQPNIVNENCDTITMPDDELDNLSEVTDTFASSARRWRDEYEARLDAIQKRMTNE